MQKVFLIPIIGLLIISGWINIKLEKPRVVINKQTSAINFNNDFLSVFDLGQRRLLSSLLWVMTLLESDLEHYKNKDLQSWLYLRFKTIANLDPLFLENYQFGGLYLSIVKDDLLGAEDIFLKGLKFYPEDYELNYNLGFLYAIEAQEYKKSVPYLNKIKNNPKAPSFIDSLLIKIQHEVHNNNEISFQLLNDLYSKTQNEYIKDKVGIELYQLKALIDLECLNDKKRNDCDSLDFEGKPYIKVNGIYKANKEINSDFGVRRLEK